MKYTQPLVSFVVPCGKEPHRIVSALLAIDAYCAQKNLSYEILVITYTTDSHTREVIHRCQTIVPHVRVLDSKTTHIGLAIQKGMLDARGLIRIYTPPLCASLVHLYELTETYFRKGYDVVVGSRFTSENKKTREVQVERIFQRIQVFILSLCVSDIGSGWTAYSQKSALSIFPHTTISSDLVIGESLFIARQAGMRIKEIPLTASIRMWKNTTQFITKIVDAIHIQIKNMFHIYPPKKGL